MASLNSTPMSGDFAPNPYYRRYDLPWSPSEEIERRFRRILRDLGIVFAIVAIAMPFLPHHRQLINTNALPPRAVALVLQPPPPPPPPPPPRRIARAIEPARPTPAPKPVNPRARLEKTGLLASLDELAALRNQTDIEKFAKDQPRTRDPGDVTAVQRSLITAKAGATSGGISAPTSSGLAAGSGSLNGYRAARVGKLRLAAGGERSTRRGGSGMASRSAEEVALVFDKNKGAIYALYTRAIRRNPALQGKVVVELAIAPSGTVTAAHIVSSDLHDPELEAELIALIRQFRFKPKDVAPLITTKPIDFFPA
ncbi:MAG TPA: AgmX/PglI C-terminal domain-containing protein [Steroidobacteraceae bacterium]|nr:AgmX/PglI C-terminal domain-containing protein [Steroidobacteraceae bacterium]